MADTKITALAPIGANPINVATFPIPMVDLLDHSMAASGTTKQVTVNQILGAGGTATLASATISGDLTVATNRFAVSASGVGIGTTTMTYNLNVTGTAPTVTGIKLINTSGTSSNLCMFSASSAYASFGVPNNAGWLAVEGSNPLAIGPTGNGGIVFVNNGSEAMRLNSTGLGVGGSPTKKLEIVGTASATVEIAKIGAASGPYVGIGTEGTNYSWIQAFGGKPLQINPQGNDTILNPSSGNVGIGVTPSYKLHVNGRVSYSTGIGEGADLTLSSTGTQVQHGISSTWTSQNFYTGGTSRVVMKQNGQVRFVPLAADPAGAEDGDVYYNSTSNKLKCYNGTTWNDLF